MACAATLSAALSDRAKWTSGDLDSRLYLGKMAKLLQGLRRPEADMVQALSEPGASMPNSGAMRKEETAEFPISLRSILSG